MVAEGHTVASLTGDTLRHKRDEIIDSFRKGEAKVLITTNVLARGIDVQTVSMVINYVRYLFPSPSPSPLLFLFKSLARFPLSSAA
jgi:late competence protein required for DNA uptake (superfamily II DNA/RNA helicase)